MLLEIPGSFDEDLRGVALELCDGKAVLASLGGTIPRNMDGMGLGVAVLESWDWLLDMG